MTSVRIVNYFNLEDSFYTDRTETLFCSPSWVRVLQKTYGFKCFSAIDDRTGTCIPFVLVDNLMGKKGVSLPFSDYTDINTDTPEKYVDLIAKMETDFPDIPLIFKTIGNTGDPDTELWGDPVRTAYYHRIETCDMKKLLEAQSSSFKRNVSKAQKNGISVRTKNDKAALNDFYRLYHGLRMNKFNSIPQPYSFFENVFDEFMAKDKGFILEAVFEGKVIASIIVLRYKKVLYYKFGASDEKNLDLRPNNLIFDELIRCAHDDGFQQVDLGLSGIGESYRGLVRFKESMGGYANHIVYYKKGGQGQEQKNENLGQWIKLLTGEIVSAKPDPETVSRFSELIYPLFA